MRLKKNKKGVYYVLLKYQGKRGRKKISMRTKNIDEAALRIKELDLENVERAAQMKLIRKDVLAKMVLQEHITIAAAIEKWREWQTIRVSPTTLQHTYEVLLRFAKAVGVNKTVVEVQGADVDKFINEPCPRKAATRKWHLSIIIGLFKYLRSHGFTMEDICLDVRVRMEDLTFEQKEPKKAGPFSEEDYERLKGESKRMEAKWSRKRHHLQSFLCQADDDRTRKNLTKRIDAIDRLVRRVHFWRDVMEIAWETGLRLGDIINLESRSLTVYPGFITVWTEKTNRRVKVKVSDALYTKLTSNTLENYMFPEWRKVPIGHLTVEFCRHVDRAKIGHGSFHSFRYAYIQRAKAAGVPLNQIRQDVGHATEKMTEHYATG